jgi:hypothetical protein
VSGSAREPARILIQLREGRGRSQAELARYLKHLAERLGVRRVASAPTVLAPSLRGENTSYRPPRLLQRPPVPAEVPGLPIAGQVDDHLTRAGGVLLVGDACSAFKALGGDRTSQQHLRRRPRSWPPALRSCPIGRYGRLAVGRIARSTSRPASACSWAVRARSRKSARSSSASHASDTSERPRSGTWPPSPTWVTSLTAYASSDSDRS